LLDEVQAARFAPAIILRRLGELVQQLQREGCLNEWQWQALDRKLDTMSEILGGCERIDTTPIPYTYRVLLNRTVTIYSLLLPMGLVSSIGWLTPPIAVFIAYTYLALEVIGEELEEPFGREGNDLPLAALCHTIESAVREMQGLPVTVEAPKPQGCICTEAANNKGCGASAAGCLCGLRRRALLRHATLLLAWPARAGMRALPASSWRDRRAVQDGWRGQKSPVKSPGSRSVCS
jgi:hypothetical protein